MSEIKIYEDGLFLHSQVMGENLNEYQMELAVDEYYKLVNLVEGQQKEIEGLKEERRFDRESVKEELTLVYTQLEDSEKEVKRLKSPEQL